MIPFLVLIDANLAYLKKFPYTKNKFPYTEYKNNLIYSFIYIYLQNKLRLLK